MWNRKMTVQVDASDNYNETKYDPQINQAVKMFIDLRTHLDHEGLLYDLTKEQITNELSKTVILNLTIRSVGRSSTADRALASLGLLNGFSNLRIGERRKRIKEITHFQGKPESLCRKEESAYRRIATYFYNKRYDNSDQFRVFLSACKKSEFYDSSTGRAILPDPFTADNANAAGSEVIDSSLLSETPVRKRKSLGKIINRICLCLLIGSLLIPFFALYPSQGAYYYIAFFSIFAAFSVMAIHYLANEVKSFSFSFDARRKGDEAWMPDVWGLQSGDTIQLRATYASGLGESKLLKKFIGHRLNLTPLPRDAILKVVLNPYLEYIDNSTAIIDATHPRGIKIDNNDIVDQGLHLADYSTCNLMHVYVDCRISRIPHTREDWELGVYGFLDLKDSRATEEVNISVSPDPNLNN